MYVILDRALPHLGDGLKPVQRRIVYAMSELGLSAGQQAQEVRAHRRRRDRQVPSARRLGLLRSHGAHGAAVLRTAIRSSTGRATGARRTIRSPSPPCATPRRGSRATREVLLGELEHGTVDWTPNFDGTLEEPTLLPARLPNVLLNGTIGHRGRHGDRHSAAQPARSRERAASHLLDEPDATHAHAR